MFPSEKLAVVALVGESESVTLGKLRVHATASGSLSLVMVGTGATKPLSPMYRDAFIFVAPDGYEDTAYFLADVRLGQLPGRGHGARRQEIAAKK